MGVWPAAGMLEIIAVVPNGYNLSQGRAHHLHLCFFLQDLLVRWNAVAEKIDAKQVKLDKAHMLVKKSEILWWSAWKYAFCVSTIVLRHDRDMLPLQAEDLQSSAQALLENLSTAEKKLQLNQNFPDDEFQLHVMPSAVLFVCILLHFSKKNCRQVLTAYLHRFLWRLMKGN